MKATRLGSSISFFLSSFITVEDGKNNLQNGLIRLFGQIHEAVELSCSVQNRKHFTIMIDDLSLLEIAIHGSTNDVLDFLHYCTTINSNVVSLLTTSIMIFYNYL